jgi:hypothetical protein
MKTLLYDWAGGRAQVAKHLPSKCEAPSSSPSVLLYGNACTCESPSKGGKGEALKNPNTYKLGCSSTVEHLPSMCVALDSIPHNNKVPIPCEPTL